MTLLRPTPIPLAQLRWQPVDRTLSVEISSLGPRFRFGLVYDDAVDAGLTVVGAYREIVFVESAEPAYGSEGELLYYTLEPVLPADRETVTSLTVYND